VQAADDAERRLGEDVVALILRDAGLPELPVEDPVDAPERLRLQ